MEQFAPPSRQEYDASGAWGLLTSVDLHECNPVTIRDADMIGRFATTLCKRLEVKAYGQPQVVEFGDDPRVHGYSLTQLIESSLISAHFAEQTNSVYLDIFSCKYYDPEEVVKFAMEFFHAEHCRALCVLRGSKAPLPRKLQAEFTRRNILLQPASQGRKMSPRKAA